MTKHDILKNDPQTFTEAVYMHILNSGRFCENDFIRHSGFGGRKAVIRQAEAQGRPEFIKAKQRQYIGPNGCKFDNFTTEWNGQFFNDVIDEMDAINIITDTLANYTREQIINSFIEINPFDNAPFEITPEDEFLNLNTLPTGLEFLDYSPKSFVIYGPNTYTHKETLKKYGGRFNPYLTHPSTLEAVKGWIFPNSKKEIILLKLAA